MLKIFHTLFVLTVFGSAVLKADEAAMDAQAEEPANEESAVAAEEPPTAESAVELSESELVEMVGFLTAQAGGVPLLNLDTTAVNALTDGLVDGLNGTKTIEDFSQERIQQVFSEVQQRADAIAAESETIPELKEDTLRALGFVMALQSGLVQLEFEGEEVSLIKKGFIAGAYETDSDPSEIAKRPEFQEFIKKRVEAAQSKAAAQAEVLKAERQAASKVFFDELAADSTVLKSESGLYYKILEPGAAEKPTLDDSVKVHYKGTLIDGTQFDSSYDRGKPADFPLKGVVKGFGEGLTKIGAGGKIILYIPSELGYGDNPRPGGLIKPGDPLVFECELIAVNP